MMVNRAGRARRIRAYFAVAVGALAATFATGGARAGDDESQKNVFQRMMDGFGAKSDPPIDYRERSPLVVPPRLELPPPEEAGGERKSAAWPTDAGVKRRQLEEVAKRKSKKVTTEQISTAPVDENGKPLSQWSEVTKIFGIGGQETATFKAEPPRNDLVEPPPGYRTPSAEQPYGIGVKKKAEQTTEPQQPKSLEDRTTVPR